MALYDQNQNVAAGPGTPGYTYVNGVLTSVGGVPTGYPTVSAPTNPGTLQGTLTTPPPPTTPTPAPAATSSTPSAGLDQNSFMNLLGTLNGGLQQNNALVDQKNAVVNAMLGNPTDPNILSKLPPDIQSIIQKGDRSALMLQAGILNNAIQGRNDSVANAIKFLSTDYQNSVQQAQAAQQKAEATRQDAFKTLLDLSKSYTDASGKIDVTKLSAALQAMYPGVDVSSVISLFDGLKYTSSTSATAPKILGSASSGYFKYDPTTSTLTPITSGTGGPTSTGTKAQQQKNDVAAAILDFQTQMKDKNWAGANPDAYTYYKQELIKAYGAAAGLALDAAMKTAGVTVDYTNK